ncbi:hypothetical protein GALL_551630 [mine drainage metagenome]|uniref:Uncharacterized protein n=1 Tax=mine drainage metagenome TaxID=410659 RepID=A0A1J5NYJ4_9ZZZZ
MVFEQTLVAVIFELKAQPKMAQPAGWRLWPVEMDLRFLVREVVGVTLQFERRASADGERVIEERLKRDDKLLPGERATVPAVNAPCRLIEPARAYIVAEQLSRIAVFLEPRRVDENSLGQFTLKPV